MQENTIVKQSQESSSKGALLYTGDQTIPCKPVEGAIETLCNTISEEDTITVYQKAAGKTWNLIVQVIAIIIFLFRLSIALIIWVWGIAFKSGQYFRKWLESNQPTFNEIVYAVFEALGRPLNRLYQWAASLIKKYLGWEVNFEDPTAKSSTTKAEDTTNTTPTTSNSAAESSSSSE